MKACAMFRRRNASFGGELGVVVPCLRMDMVYLGENCGRHVLSYMIEMLHLAEI